jgi:PTS system ascorbate-specific IIC component
MKYLSYAGIALVIIVLIAIPQLQYRKDKKNYFLITDDYEAYKKAKEVK